MRLEGRRDLFCGDINRVEAAPEGKAEFQLHGIERIADGLGTIGGIDVAGSGAVPPKQDLTLTPALLPCLSCNRCSFIPGLTTSFFKNFVYIESQ